MQKNSSGAARRGRLPPPRPAAGAPPPPPAPQAGALPPTIPAPPDPDAPRVDIPPARRVPATQPLSTALETPLPGARRLFVSFRGRNVSVDKPRWIIGRDPRSADFAIEDAGVSRRHAMVEIVDGRWTMVDLGSTNGVAYSGYRLARKEIVGGDVFVINGHELKFWFE